MSGHQVDVTTLAVWRTVDASLEGDEPSKRSQEAGRSMCLPSPMFANPGKFRARFSHHMRLSRRTWRLASGSTRMNRRIAKLLKF
jgi:hypothetical protein